MIWGWKTFSFSEKLEGNKNLVEGIKIVKANLGEKFAETNSSRESGFTRRFEKDSRCHFQKVKFKSKLSSQNWLDKVSLYLLIYNLTISLIDEGFSTLTSSIGPLHLF